MSNFLPNIAMILAGRTVLIARARENYIRPIVMAYKTKILSSREWFVDGSNGQKINDPKHAYLLSQKDYKLFDELCQIEAERNGLTVSVAGMCPLAEAEYDLVNAKIELIRAMESVNDLRANHAREMLPEILNEAVEMRLRLMGPRIEKSLSDLAGHLMRVVNTTQNETVKEAAEKDLKEVVMTLGYGQRVAGIFRSTSGNMNNDGLNIQALQTRLDMLVFLGQSDTAAQKILSPEQFIKPNQKSSRPTQFSIIGHDGLTLNIWRPSDSDPLSSGYHVEKEGIPVPMSALKKDEIIAVYQWIATRYPDVSEDMRNKISALNSVRTRQNRP